MAAKRSWAAAREKVDREGRCRRCGSTRFVEAAHLVPRSRVNADGGAEDDRNICPLCSTCHREFDSGRADLLGIVTNEEAAYAVLLVGFVEAGRRLSGDRDILGRAA